MADQVVGWTASLVLLLTIASQVVKQWREGVEGVSIWLFVGQIAASIGFVVYSALKSDLVFIVTNSLILVSAVVGLVSFGRGKRKSARNGERRPLTLRDPAPEGAA